MEKTMEHKMKTGSMYVGVYGDCGVEKAALLSNLYDLKSVGGIVYHNHTRDQESL